LIDNNLVYWHRIGFDDDQTSPMTNHLPKTVVFITGTFVGSNCWDAWKIDFELNGYACLTPPWPHKNASPEELRNRHPDSAIASNRLAGLTDYFANIVNDLPEKPIFIGHSLGGLIVQLLLQRGLGKAGIAIHSFPPAGIHSCHVSFLRAVWPALSFFSSTRKTYMISFKKWNHDIANGMDCEEQKQSFYKYAIPESKLVFRDLFKPEAKIDFKKNHSPLLLISGSSDRIISPSLNFDNYKKYKMSNSTTDYMEFKDHNYLVFEYPAWKEMADFIRDWLLGLQ
jgi:pimeloyl-ACP methyl ester carboxylesterase